MGAMCISKDKSHKAFETLWDLMRNCIGGEGGIRTHVQAINPQPDFESGPLRPLRYLSALRTATNLES